MQLIQGFSEQWIGGLCAAIDMPEEATRAILQQLPNVQSPAVIALAGGLTEPETAQDACGELTQRFGAEDEDGFGILAVMLAACCLLPDKLAAHGLGSDVFLATARCFSRFVEECTAIRKHPGFDRAAWTWRQTSGLLVRLGELEVERVMHYPYAAFGALEPDRPALAIHIPRGARLSVPAVADSAARARALWPGLPFFCNSWILAPALDAFLPEDSRLRAFRSCFLPGPASPQDTSYMRWLFPGCSEQTPQEWPETTRLQRAVKAHVQNGGTVGSALGQLREDVLRPS